jgi:hypothetical protein
MKKWTKELNRVFAKKEVQIAKNPKKHMKKCSFTIKEMQIKTMLRFYLTCVWLPQRTQTANIVKDVEKKER